MAHNQPWVWDAPAPDKLDRLSILPPELLCLVFEFVAEFADEDDPRPLIISKALWAHTRPTLYRYVEITTTNSLVSFLRAVSQNFELAKHVHYLHVNLSGWASDPPGQSQSQVRLPVGAAQFWFPFVRLTKLDIFNRFPLAESLILLSRSSGVCLAKLEAVNLRDEWNQWPSPLGPEHFRNLFKLAPNLSQFALATSPFYRSLTLDPTPDPPYHLRDKLDALTLTGPFATAPHDAAELIGSFKTISHLHLDIRETPPVNHLGAVFDAIGRVEIEGLSVAFLAERLARQQSRASNWSLNLARLTTVRKLWLDLSTQLEPDLAGQLPPNLVLLGLSAAYAIKPRKLVVFTSTLLDVLPEMRVIIVDWLPAWGLALGNPGKRGPSIMRRHGPDLAVGEDGAPVFEPLPGWSLAEFKHGLRDCERVLEAVREAALRGVELKGRLVDAARVTDEWQAELELCVQLRAQYDRGGLEWNVWPGHNYESGSDSGSDGDDEAASDGARAGEAGAGESE